MARASIAIGILLLIPLSLGSHARQGNGQPIPFPPQPGVAQATRLLRTGTSSISGRIVATSGQPLRLASVGAGSVELNGNTTATTDADGRYEMASLPAGRYILTALKANYVGLSYGQSRPGDLEQAVVLADNQRLTGVDITLPRAGVIAGRVLDEYGEPVIDAQVTPLTRRVVQGQFTMMPTGRSATTNDIGEYRLFGLTPGQYYVSSTLRATPLLNSGVRTSYAPTYHPSATAIGSAQPIAVGLGDTVAGVDVQLQAVGVAVISGAAVDGEGRPLAGGSVAASDRSTVSGGGTAGVVRQDGSFTLPPLPPGEYLLRASRPPPQPPPGTQVSGPRPPIEVSMASVTLNGSDIEGVLLTPLKRVNVSGQVIFNGAAPRPRSATIRLNLLARSAEAAFGLTQPPPTAVGPNFSVQFQAPAAGILIRATTGSPVWEVKTIRVGGIDVTDTGIDLRGGRDVDNLEVELTDRPQEVSGVVLDARGAPVAASVLVFPDDRDRWVFDSRLISAARADASGQFKIRTLPPGRYLAVIVHVGFVSVAMQDPDELDSFRRRATPFRLTEGETKTLNLRVP